MRLWRREAFYVGCDIGYFVSGDGGGRLMMYWADWIACRIKVFQMVLYSRLADTMCVQVKILAYTNAFPILILHIVVNGTYFLIFEKFTTLCQQTL